MHTPAQPTGACIVWKGSTFEMVETIASPADLAEYASQWKGPYQVKSCYLGRRFGRILPA